MNYIPSVKNVYMIRMVNTTTRTLILPVRRISSNYILIFSKINNIYIYLIYIPIYHSSKGGSKGEAWPPPAPSKEIYEL